MVKRLALEIPAAADLAIDGREIGELVCRLRIGHRWKLSPACDLQLTRQICRQRTALLEVFGTYSIVEFRI